MVGLSPRWWLRSAAALGLSSRDAGVIAPPSGCYCLVVAGARPDRSKVACSPQGHRSLGIRPTAAFIHRSKGYYALPPGMNEPATSQDTDLELVQRTVAGDQRAYGLLVLKYKRRIQRLIGRMVRDVDLVEDIAQETFIRAYRGLHQFRGDAQFYTWLYRIAVNTAKKSLLELKRDPTVATKFFAGDEEDETSWRKNEPISDETPESVLAAKEIAAVVNSAMSELSEDLRRAVTLREIEGLSYEEIALALDCPIGTVRSRIFRAREAISAKLKPLLEHQMGKRW